LAKSEATAAISPLSFPRHYGICGGQAPAGIRSPSPQSNPFVLLAGRSLGEAWSFPKHVFFLPDITEFALKNCVLKRKKYFSFLIERF
jgi:hypothetical protein